MNVEKRPVAILQHHGDVGPGYFEDWLREHRIDYRLVRIDQGEPVPGCADDYAGICSLGGPMSVNDAPPWIGPELLLLRSAVGAGVPVIGHCLGGQLLAKALGARVARAPVAEIGWGDVEVADAAAARDWFGGRTRFALFQWHYETFELPRGALRVLRNPWTANQAFVADGRHIGFQGHVEITAAIARAWVAQSGGELPARSTPSTQCAEDLLRDLDARVAASNAVADDVYARWARHLAG